MRASQPVTIDLLEVFDPGCAWLNCVAALLHQLQGMMPLKKAEKSQQEPSTPSGTERFEPIGEETETETETEQKGQGA